MSPEVNSAQVFFVGGQGKSGTTWLELLLDAHPEISCRGEAHFGDVLIPLLDRVFQEYRGFLHTNNAKFSELPGYPADSTTGVANAARAWIRTCLQSQVDSSKKNSIKAIGERTPANIERVRELTDLFPFCRIIHVIRDPRDIAVSLWFHGQRTNPQAFDKQYGSLAGLAEHLAPVWAAAMRSARDFGNSVKERYCEVRYEALQKAPGPTLGDLFRFLNVETSDDIVQRCIDSASFAKVSGREPGAEDKGSHFRKGIVGDWENHLDDATRKIFRKQAGELLDDLGYGS